VAAVYSLLNKVAHGSQTEAWLTLLPASRFVIMDLLTETAECAAVVAYSDATTCPSANNAAASASLLWPVPSGPDPSWLLARLASTAFHRPGMGSCLY
jgi:hypothetical protein